VEQNLRQLSKKITRGISGEGGGILVRFYTKLRRYPLIYVREYSVCSHLAVPYRNVEPAWTFITLLHVTPVALDSIAWVSTTSRTSITFLHCSILIAYHFALIAIELFKRRTRWRDVSCRNYSLTHTRVYAFFWNFTKRDNTTMIRNAFAFWLAHRWVNYSILHSWILCNTLNHDLVYTSRVHCSERWCIVTETDVTELAQFGYSWSAL